MTVRVAMIRDHDLQKYTAIWQSKTPHEYDWMCELFGDLIAEHVFDGDHKIVMDNAILIDSFIHKFDESYYRQFSGKNAFLVHVLDETYAGGYSRYTHFKGVLRDHHSTKFNPRRVFDIPNGYYKRRKSTAPVKAAKDRPYIWSMVGEVNKSTRPDVMRALLPLTPFFVMATSSTYGIGNTGRPRASLDTDRYYDVIENSVFSPAPMGNVNVGCFRPYEAMEVGSIPIVEKRMFLDYYKNILGSHPMPTVSSWSQAAKLMESLLRQPEKLAALQVECTEFWKDCKLRLRRDIEEFMVRNGQETSGAKMYSPLIDNKYYAYLELLKHHSFRAFLRRIKRQWQRLRIEKRWRVS